MVICIQQYRMNDLSFTLAEAQEYAERGAIEQWVHAFLTTEGHNPKFSEGLRLKQRYWGSDRVGRKRASRGPAQGIGRKVLGDHLGQRRADQ